MSHHYSHRGRTGNWFYRHHIPLLPLIIKLVIRIIYSSSVDPATSIGKGTKLAYGGIAVVIHKDVIIGQNVIISQGVTIGGRSKIQRLPIIKDNVYIGAGAKILGDLTVGEGAVIGANAVVIKDVPPYSVAAGVPAKIIKTGISREDYV